MVKQTVRQTEKYSCIYSTKGLLVSDLTVNTEYVLLGEQEQPN